MKLYKKLKIENANNLENLAKIDQAKEMAIENMLKYAEVAIKETHVNQDGFLRFIYALPNGNPTEEMPESQLHDENELQAIFDEKFAEIIRLDFSELTN